MAMALLVLSVLPFAAAVDTGIGVGIGVGTESFDPRIWMCDSRVMIDDDVEPGRVQGCEVFAQKVELCAGDDDTETYCNEQCNLLEGTWCGKDRDGCYDTCIAEAGDAAIEDGNPDDTYCPIMKGAELKERENNYAFEGEKLEWKVLVMDKNKIEEISDVVGTIGATQGSGNDIEVECVRLNGFAAPGDYLLEECNARILEEELDEFDDQTMAYYECTLTVETPDSMYGEYFITVQANSANAAENNAVMDENEYFFLNPTIAVSIDDGGNGILFKDNTNGGVRPGTIAYSNTILVGNDADVGSGVTLDMFISGTDFYDSTSLSGARCVITNRLKLGNNYVDSGNNGWNEDSDNECEIGFGDTDDHLCYFATNGAYSTALDGRNDPEGYAPIVYGDYFSTNLYNDAEIIQANRAGGGYWNANLLVPGSEMALTFKLGLPEPCVGTFTDGSIYFWGEAI